MIQLTPHGKLIVKEYLKRLREKREIILDIGIDTADETVLPDMEDICTDIPFFETKDGEYFNNWGCTDNFDGDSPLYLKRGLDYFGKE